MAHYVPTINGTVVVPHVIGDAIGIKVNVMSSVNAPKIEVTAPHQNIIGKALIPKIVVED